MLLLLFLLQQYLWLTMPVKITKNLKSLKSLPQRIEKKFSQEAKKDFGEEVVEQIVKGKSPVRSHTFTPYSDKYGAKKGGVKPVDMIGLKRGGKMLKSIKVTRVTGGGISVRFDDPKAKYHNDGEGNLPERKLLPTNKGETFNTYLTKILNKLLNRAVKKEVKK